MDNSCVVCGDGFSRLYAKPKNLEIMKCTCCGIAFLKHFTPINYSDGHYYEAWWSDEKQDRRNVQLIKEKTANWILDQLNPFLKPSSRILEVGCAYGFFLKVAQQRGYRMMGLEISGAEQKARQAGFEVRSETLEELKGFEQSFDAVVMFDVIEHFDHPNRALQIVKRILKKNGILAVVTPDVESFSCKVLRAYWPHWKEEHIIYYSKRGLSKLFELNGFKIEAMKTAWKATSLRLIASHNARYKQFPEFLSSWLRWLPFSTFSVLVPSELFCVASKTDCNTVSPTANSD